MTYHKRVFAYEAKGCTTSDAQAMCDAEDMKGETMTPTPRPKSSTKPYNTATQGIAMTKEEKNTFDEAKAILARILSSEVDGSYVAAAPWWQDAKAVLAKMEKGTP